MLHRIFAVLALLALSLAAVSPALADKPEGKPEGKPEARPATATLKGKAFQGTIVSEDPGAISTWSIATDRYGTLTVDVSKAKFKVPFVKNADRSAFQKGDRVAVKLKDRPQGSGPYQARAVHFIPGKSIFHFTGVVTDVTTSDSTTTLKVKNGKGEEKTFTVSATFPVRARPDTKTATDLKKDDKVTVVARMAAPNVALAIRIHGPD